MCLLIAELESSRRFGSRRILTRDKGTQSSPQDLSSSRNSPDSAPSIKEITVTSCGMEGETPEFHDQLKTKEYEVSLSFCCFERWVYRVDDKQE